MATRTTGSGGNAGSYILTQYGYDGYGRQNVVADNAGHETVTSFDADGRVVQTVANYVNGVDAADTDTDQTTGYVYDVLGRLATQIAYNPDGQAVQTQETRYVYAADGNRTVPVAVVYGDSGDTLSQDTSTGFWSITSGSDHVSTTYDVLGRKLTSTDQRGVEHTYAYDDADRLVSDAVTNLGDSGQNVDGSVRRIGWTYDDLGRVATVTSFDDPEEGEGNIVNQIAYAYDGWGNVATVWQSDAGEVVTSGENPSPCVQYTYEDGAGEGDAALYVRLTSVTYPNGRVITYHYDGADGMDNVLSRLSRIADEDDETTYAAYTYLGAGTIMQVDHPAVEGGLTLSYDPGSSGTYTGWDRFGRVISQTWTVGTTSVDSYGYTYDMNSNPTGRANLLDTDLSELYTYDGLDRLTSTARSNSTSQDWTLDALGNWAGYTEAAGETTTLDQTRSHDAANQTSGIDTTTGATWVTPTYDAAGNMITCPQPGAETTTVHLTYDAWNRLVKVNADDDGNAGDLIAQYQYDGQGHRTAKIVQQGTGENATYDRTDYLYNDSWQCLEEQTASYTSLDGTGGALTTVATTASVQYLWDPRYVDAPVLRWRSVNGTLDETLYYCQDANMNVTALIDPTTGEAVEHYAYDSYGKTTIYNGTWTATRTASAFANNVLFAGYYRDSETGLFSVQHRYYHPTLGSWVGRDPSGYVDGMSLYQYCRANPARGTDPSGLDMMLDNDPGYSGYSGSSDYGSAYVDQTPTQDYPQQDGYDGGDNGFDGSGYSLGSGDGGAGDQGYWGDGGPNAGQDGGSYSSAWGDGGPSGGQNGQGYSYDGGDGAGQSVPDYSHLCGNIGDTYGANTDDWGMVTTESAPGSSQDPCQEILAGIQNDVAPAKNPNAVDNDPTPFQAGVRGFVDGLGAGAANVLQALALYQSDYLNQARDRAWSDQPTRGTWMETGSRWGGMACAVGDIGGLAVTTLVPAIGTMGVYEVAETTVFGTLGLPIILEDAYASWILAFPETWNTVAGFGTGCINGYNGAQPISGPTTPGFAAGYNVGYPVGAATKVLAETVFKK